MIPLVTMLYLFSVGVWTRHLEKNIGSVEIPGERMLFYIIISYWGESGYFRMLMYKDNLGIEKSCSWAVPKLTY